MKATLDKPKTFSADLARLPLALKPFTKQKRWVIWRWTWNGTKWDKPPYQSKNPRKKAASNNPKTWSSYAAAVKAVKDGKADGIGYVLTKSKIAAADLDDCRDPESGKLTPWAEKIVAEAQAAGVYVETTVSGTGLRTIGTAVNDEKFDTKLRLENGSIELYRHAVRYITISGLQIGNTRKLPNIDPLLDRTHAQYGHESKSGNGKFSGVYPPAERAEIEAALAVIPSDDYAIWFEVGCALHKELGDDGFELFEQWSKKSEKYDARQCAKKWRECEKVSGYNVGTIFLYAKEAAPGWRARYEEEKLQRIYTASNEHAQKSNTKPETKPAISATPWVRIDPAKVPPREWLYRPNYIRKFASATVGHSKVGKSAKVMVEALAMVTGKPLLDVRPDGKLRVWYWNGEDPKVESDRRLAAINLHYGIKKEDLGDRLFVDSGRTMPIVIAEGDRIGTRIAVPVIEAMIATLLNNKIDVLIIDPFVACHRVSENDNRAIESVAKSWAQIAEVTNSAIMLVHHSRKTYGDDVTAESSRGASALIAAVRAVQVLNVMSKQEADNLCIEENERRRYIRSDNSEANMSRPALTAIWCRIESVILGNLLGGGDDVGVAASWYPQVHKAGTSDELRAWQAVKSGGPWRESSQSTKEPWVGLAIAQALNMELRFRGNQKAVRALIAQGLKKGWLKRIEKSDDHRKKRVFIEASDVPPASALPESK